MPLIDICFSGWVRGAKVEKVTNVQGQTINVSEWSADKLSLALEKGEVFISLADYLEGDSEIELFDFAATR